MFNPLSFSFHVAEDLTEYVTTMVCVAVKGVPMIGVIHQPFLKETGMHNIRPHNKKIGDRPFDFTNQGRGRGRCFFNFFDDPKIKPVYALEPCKQV
jgi:hypothetical protein